MIFGDLAHWDKEKTAFSQAIVKGVEYIRNTDFHSLAPGKYEIEGKRMFAIVQEVETKSKSLIKAENHQQYIDIQYVFQGEELIGFARQSPDQLVTENFIESRDVCLYEGISNEMDLKLHAGNFVVFFPDDLHRPCCTLRNEMKVKRAVVKIHVSLLEV